MKTIVIVGGGAAGFFAAINHKIKFPENEVIILEQSQKVLQKVRISGGGRCNVTHHCFEPKLFVKNYPRGKKELLEAFAQFQALDTLKWFESRKVRLKTEADGRMFPITDSSQSIIDCFMKEIQRLAVRVELGCGVESFEQKDKKWLIFSKNKVWYADKLLITTGSSPKIWQKLADLGHKIATPVPSLFTFNVSDARLLGLQGLSVEHIGIRILGSKLEQQGAWLITHWGMSAPAVLKLSAWGARELYEKNYKFVVAINFLPSQNFDSVRERLLYCQKDWQKRKIFGHTPFALPLRLWQSLLVAAQIEEQKIWGEVAHKNFNKLAEQLTNAQFEVSGKSIFKDEFVTCGGVERSEIDFKTMQSKLFEGLFFAGEVIDIDAITGGFNFQAAWTTAWIASQNM